MAEILINCDNCGKPFNKRPDKIAKDKNHYCSKACSRCFRKAVTLPCVICGTPVTRCQSQMTANACCSNECTRLYSSQKLSALNRDLNPDRMILETREKLRNSRLGKGEGKTYEKTYSRHTHRVVAEQMLGRKLLPGEVVHHEDENKRNNDPSNLRVFASQAEHAAYHKVKNLLG